MTNCHQDIWLNIFCPEDACLREEERIDLLQKARFCPDNSETSGENDAWIETFCPEQTCEVTQPTALP